MKASAPLGAPWKLSAALLLSFVALAGCSQRPAAAPVLPVNGQVIRVVDGDTIEAKVGRKTERVRLIGIDTPETVHPSKPVGCYGPEASAFTKHTLPSGTALHLVLDAEAHDTYGRLLAYVYRAQDGLFVNQALAQDGYANVLTIPPNVAHTEDFVASVREARDADRGLWGACPAS